MEIKSIQEFNHQLKEVVYKLVLNSKYNQWRIQIFVDNEFINDYDVKSLESGKTKLKELSELRICPVYI